MIKFLSSAPGAPPSINSLIPVLPVVLIFAVALLDRVISSYSLSLKLARDLDPAKLESPDPGTVAV